MTHALRKSSPQHLILAWQSCPNRPGASSARFSFEPASAVCRMVCMYIVCTRYLSAGSRPSRPCDPTSLVSRYLGFVARLLHRDQPWVTAGADSPSLSAVSSKPHRERHILMSPARWCRLCWVRVRVRLCVTSSLNGHRGHSRAMGIHGCCSRPSPPPKGSFEGVDRTAAEITFGIHNGAPALPNQRSPVAWSSRTEMDGPCAP